MDGSSLLFPTLSKSNPCYPKITPEILDTLSHLQSELKHYFPFVTNDKYGWVIDPFASLLVILYIYIYIYIYILYNRFKSNQGILPFHGFVSLDFPHCLNQRRERLLPICDVIAFAHTNRK